MSRLAYAAVAAVSVAVLNSYSAAAQEPPTPGGDVTADQASVLPPVVVQSPNEPIARRTKPKRKAPVIEAASSGTPTNSTAEASGEPDIGSLGEPGGFNTGGGPAIGVGVFTLGQIDMIGGSTITNEAMWTFHKQSLGQAANILPGVSWASTGAPSANSSGARNEGDIYVRGFNRFQVPLSIDGVRIYLPYDNRLDMNRFLTPDLAEVQIAKGYVSVLNGPGGEGGAINLVSRKPMKEIEIEGRSGLVLNGDASDMNSWSSYAYAGTRQKGYYAQLSGTIVDQRHFSLSDDFNPATPATLGYLSTFPYENGGDRDHSRFEDWRINAKVGITPNATDEYTINYTTQSGMKDSPLHVNRQIVQGYTGTAPRFWRWPEWDVSTLSWLSKTRIGSASYIKSNFSYNTFDNTLSFYPDATYTHQTSDSPYRDHSYGGFVEMGTDLIPMNTLKGAIHYRRDTHTESTIDYDYTTTPRTAMTDPTSKKRQSEETWSFAVENTFHATRYLDLVTGISYDMVEVLEAAPGLDTPHDDAWNWQAAAIYSYSPTGKIHADVSSRTRFPTLFDRYSTRFGSLDPNPNVDPERATNYEIGISDVFYRDVHVSSAIFYSDIDKSIQNAFSAANGKNSIVGFNADGYNYGFELSLDWDVTRRLRIGGNYTYLNRHLDFADAASTIPSAPAAAAVAASEIEGTPRHKAFIYASWKATDHLTLTPSIELASDRTALVTSCGSTLVDSAGNAAQTGQCGKAASPQLLPNYVNIGAYALVNFRAEYAFDDNTTLAIGGMNLLDENYSLAEGFPEPGRQFFASMRARF
jgi:iron complex outermembrane receptor protein